jgi:ABC-type methionine transport system ATPase subunit
VKAVRSRSPSPSHGVREKVYLTYPPKLLKEPIIYQLGQKFRIVTNIRGANISAEIGLVALELDGAENEVSAALRWLTEIGVRVEPIEKNVIE